MAGIAIQKSEGLEFSSARGGVLSKGFANAEGYPKPRDSGSI